MIRVGSVRRVFSEEKLSHIVTEVSLSQEEIGSQMIKPKQVDLRSIKN